MYEFPNFPYRSDALHPIGQSPLSFFKDIKPLGAFTCRLLDFTRVFAAAARRCRHYTVTMISPPLVENFTLPYLSHTPLPPAHVGPELACSQTGTDLASATDKWGRPPGGLNLCTHSHFGPYFTNLPDFRYLRQRRVGQWVTRSTYMNLCCY